ncbi:MAG TPA: hypothetical protein P5552_06390 [Candidatus Competibacteraceae bacterium]|nr:hypothetical protein [Candidatus Competibacteraceae bacterium]
MSGATGQRIGCAGLDTPYDENHNATGDLGFHQIEEIVLFGVVLVPLTSTIDYLQI